MFTFPNVKTWGRRRTPVAAGALENSLDAFGSETSATPTTSEPAHHSANRTLALVLTLVLIAATAVGGYLLRASWPFRLEAAAAAVTIESDPAGAEVRQAGTSRGTTPLALSLAPGDHDFELVYGGQRRALRANVRAGATVVHHVQFATATTGPSLEKKASLRIVTDPAALRVMLNGVERGRSPLTIPDLDAGTHRIRVIGTAGVVDRNVEVTAGETASVILSSATPPAGRASGPAAGWLTISAPIALTVSEGSDVIGTSVSPRIMLPAGRHTLVLANESLGFSVRRTVQVSAAERSSIRVEVPSAPLSLNAQPWAEAWVDGKRIGDTPIGNYPVQIGTHDVVFRHPEFGERRQQVTVTLTSPARVSVDMRKPGS